MENKFILRVQFGSGDRISYAHYVLDIKKYLRNVFHKSDLKEISEVVISDESFEDITDIQAYLIHNDYEV